MANASKNTDGLRPWARRKGESVQAHQALLVYLELGRERSQKKVAADLDVDVTLIARWAPRWSWNDRALAYDSVMAEAEVSARVDARAERAALWEKRRLDAAEEDFNLATELRRRAYEMLAHPLTRKKVRAKDGAVIIMPVKWNLGNVAQIVKLAADLSQSCVQIGLPADEKADDTTLDAQTEATILKFYAEAESEPDVATPGEEVA
jgi:hypothetical protein